MKFEVTRDTQVKEIIEIEFPYYYINYCEHGVYYGRLDEHRQTQICIIEDWRIDEITFNFSVEPTRQSTLGYYFSDKYKSTESEYLSAKENMISAVKSS